MRNFVLASLSTNAVVAPNNAGMLPVKSNAADNKNSDGSPFDVMLAATAARDGNPQTAKPLTDDNSHVAEKKSESAGTDTSAASTAAKDTRQAATTQAVPAKPADGKSADSKSADSKNTDSKNTGTADAKSTGKESAANDNAATDQTAQAQPPAAPPPQVPQPPAPQPVLQPDPGALAMAQAQAGAAQPSLPGIATTADDDGDTGGDAGGNVGAVGASGAKASQVAAGASPPANAGMPDIAGQAAANGDQPQAAGAPPAAIGKNFAAQLKGGDGKSAPVTGNDAKVSAQALATAPQPQVQVPQPQTTAQTPPPAAPATNAAAVPTLNFGTPVQNTDAAAVPPGTVQISAQPAGAAATVNTLAVAIAAKTQSGARQFDIRLDPPELGRVEVRLSIDASGKTEAHMTADQPETLNLLQKDSSSLTQALRDAGLDVSNSGLNFSLRGQSGQGSGGGDNNPDRGARTNLTASRAIDAAQGAASAMSFTGGGEDGRLDIHV
jgi:chemotaxis protein MotD